MFLVLLECCCTDRTELTTSKCGLEHVGCIHRPLCRTRANDGVNLVNKEYDLALGTLDLLHDIFETFFELATILCARDEKTEIKRYEFLVFE